MTSAKRTPTFARLFFVVALGFTLIGLVETAFITYDLMTGALSPLRTPDLGRGIRSWTLHHAMRPGYDIPPTAINSFGLRSPEVDVPKPEGTFRVLLLGDSYTLGFMAGEEDVFARKLEASLNASPPPGRPRVEVVNAGVLSYCPLLEYLQYKHSLHVLEPDLVILSFDMSDVQDHLLYARSGAWADDGTPLYVTEPSLLQEPSAMPGLLSWQWFGRKLDAARLRFESAAEGVPFTFDADRYLWAMDDAPDMTREAAEAMAPIADLASLLEHHGIPLVLATYPQPWQVSPVATPFAPRRNQYGIGMDTVHLNDRPFRQLEAFAASHGLPFVNATAAFRSDADPARLFLSDDFHFSPAGHDTYAAVLESFIRGRELVPGR